MSNPKIISQKKILDARLFSIDEFEIEKDGVHHTHRNVVQDDVSMVLPLNDENEVYLISQYRYLHDKIMLEGVAGFLEGSTPLEAAKKELREEAGLIAQKWTHLATVERQASVVKGNVHIFLAQDLTEVGQELEEFEEIKVLKMPFKEAINKVGKGEITVAGIVAALLILEKYLQNSKKHE